MAQGADEETGPVVVEVAQESDKPPSKIPQVIVGFLLLAALGWLVYKAATT